MALRPAYARWLALLLIAGGECHAAMAVALTDTQNSQ